VRLIARSNVNGAQDAATDGDVQRFTVKAQRMGDCSFASIACRPNNFDDATTKKQPLGFFG
jgi:hypothetical protein